MIQISKEEAMYLANVKHFQWGNDLHHTYSRYKKYYITESPKLLRALDKYRNNTAR